MTQRVSGVLITFDEPVREDDVEYLLLVLRQLDGVSDAHMVDAEPTAEYVAERRRDREWMHRLGAVQQEMLDGGTGRRSHATER